MSKGSKPRPLEIPREKFNSNWDAIFKKRVKDESSSSDSNNRVKDTKGVHQLG
jgi:hypothetical protein